MRSYFMQHPSIAWTRHATMFQLDPFVREDYLARFAAAEDCDCLVDMYESLSVGYRLGSATQWDSRFALAPSESINSNVMIPGQRDIAERIHAALPNARILITLRNQVDWLRSNYLHYMLDLPPKRRRFRDFLQTREGKLLLDAGAYDKLLTLYRDLFGPEKVHIVLLEDIAADEANVLRRLCEFLGVHYEPFDSDARELNTGIGPGRGALVKAYSSLGISDDVARKLRAWLPWAERLAAGVLTPPALSAGEVAMIRANYAVSNYQTSRILRRDLASLGYAC